MAERRSIDIVEDERHLFFDQGPCRKCILIEQSGASPHFHRVVQYSEGLSKGTRAPHRNIHLSLPENCSRCHYPAWRPERIPNKLLRAAWDVDSDLLYDGMEAWVRLAEGLERAPQELPNIPLPAIGRSGKNILTCHYSVSLGLISLPWRPVHPLELCVAMGEGLAEKLKLTDSQKATLCLVLTQVITPSLAPHYKIALAERGIISQRISLIKNQIKKLSFPPPLDVQRFRVYYAEGLLSQGALLADLKEVQLYVNSISMSPWWQSNGVFKDITIKARKEQFGGAGPKGIIYLPERPWPELYVLHEMAHYLGRHHLDHGRSYTGAMLDCVGQVLGMPQAEKLAEFYASARVEFSNSFFR